MTKRRIRLVERIRRKKAVRKSEKVAALSMLSLASSFPTISSADSIRRSLTIAPIAGKDEAPNRGLNLLLLATFQLEIVEFQQAVRKARSKRNSSSGSSWIRSAWPNKEQTELGTYTTQSSTSSSCVTDKTEDSGVCPPNRMGNQVLIRWPGLHRRAKAILDFLSASSSTSSEIQIRRVFGDSPDTSKALRILLHKKEIERYGAGGRGDPYQYAVSGQGHVRSRSELESNQPGCTSAFPTDPEAFPVISEAS